MPSILLHGLTALVWIALAQGYCRCHGVTRPRGILLRLFQWMSWLFAAYYCSKLFLDLLPPGQDCVWSLCWFSQAIILTVLPVLRHLVQVGFLSDRHPTRLWQWANYGLALVALLALALQPMLKIDVFDYALSSLTALVLWDMVRLAWGGRRPVLMADLRFGGYLTLAVFLFGGVMILLYTERGETTRQSVFWVISHAVVGLGSAAPFALRIFGEVLRGVLRNVMRLLLVGGLYLGIESWVSHAGEAFAASIHMLGVVALLILFGPGFEHLSAMIDSLVLRHSRKWREGLREALGSVPPTADPAETCEHAVRRLVEVMRLDGAAILGAAPGMPPVVSGDLDVTELSLLWPDPRASDALPEGAFDLLALDDPKLQQALYDSRVTWVVEIRSAQRSWGYLLVAAGILGNAAAHDRLQILEDFARQLALTLDVADLLCRSRAAERELARHEKLAALGETAARIAHEIRNPVAAVRSLAQSIADEPSSPLNDEHAELMIRELDRVEHHMRSLLRFARPDTYRFAPVRIDQLIWTTLDELEVARVTADVEISLDVEAVEVPADAERLRQVLLNLIDNAVEALSRSEAARQLEISLRSLPEGAQIRIADSGAGIDPQLMPRIFEPFVSTKAKGTGLGLAIARRIVEAHRGDIRAERRPGGGTQFLIYLPTAVSELDSLASGKLSAAV